MDKSSSLNCKRKCNARSAPVSEVLRRLADEPDDNIPSLDRSMMKFSAIRWSEKADVRSKKQ